MVKMAFTADVPADLTGCTGTHYVLEVSFLRQQDVVEWHEKLDVLSSSRVLSYF